jgi:hypothetical protein
VCLYVGVLDGLYLSSVCRSVYVLRVCVGVCVCVILNVHVYAFRAACCFAGELIIHWFSVDCVLISQPSIVLSVSVSVSLSLSLSLCFCLSLSGSLSLYVSHPVAQAHEHERDKLFEQLDENNTGFVTFNGSLTWAVMILVLPLHGVTL